MARPLRIERPGGRYHLTARGNERREIFRDERDRQHFLELLAELPARFGTRLHAYVLMPNHFHWRPTRAWISPRPRFFLKEAAGRCFREFKVLNGTRIIWRSAVP